jgi:hypothetical protein
MGRVISEEYGAAAGSSVVGEAYPNVMANEAIVKNDLVAIDADGRARKVKISNYAKISAEGQVVAQTSYGGANDLHQSVMPLPVLFDQNGNFFLVSTNTSATGLKLFKYSAGGTLIRSNVVDPTDSYLKSVKMFYLSNGNICIVYNISGIISYAIYDLDLNSIQTYQNIETYLTWLTYGYMDAIPLLTGGFAVSWQKNIDPSKEMRIAIYSNTGQTVVSPTTIRTSAGTAGAWAQTIKLAQLGNGNIAIVINDPATLSSGGNDPTGGMYLGIFSQVDLATIVPFNRYNTVVTASNSPGTFLVTDNYFVFSRYDNANLKTWVFDNSGLLQGSPYSIALPSQSSLQLFWDGTKALLLYGTSTGKNVLEVPLTGTGYVDNSIIRLAGLGSTIHFADFDASNSMFIMVTRPVVPSASAPQYSIFSSKGVVVKQPTDFALAASATSGRLHTIFWSSDCCFVSVFDNISTPSTMFYIGKYLSASILGVAKDSANPGCLFPVSTEAQATAHNQIVGDTTTSFDHSEQTLIGNKGVLMSYGSVLRGV